MLLYSYSHLLIHFFNVIPLNNTGTKQYAKWYSSYHSVNQYVFMVFIKRTNNYEHQICALAPDQCHAGRTGIYNVISRLNSVKASGILTMQSL